MKKILVLFICLLLIGCSNAIDNPENPTCSGDSCEVDISEDVKTLKEEYEALNGSGIDVIINENSNVKVLNFLEAKELLTSGTGVIYFGFPSCPWCRNILPTLIDVVNRNGYTLNYLNVRNVSNEDKETLKELLNDHLTTDDEGVKTLYVPDVYFVKDGKIVGNHLGSIESQENPYVALTEEQINELENIYKDLLNKVR